MKLSAKSSRLCSKERIFLASVPLNTTHTFWHSLEDVAESEVYVTRAPAWGSKISDCLRCSWMQVGWDWTPLAKAWFDLAFETSNSWASGESLPIYKSGRTASSSWDLARLQACYTPRTDLVAWTPFTSSFVVCFFLSNDFCSSSCGNLQVKPEPNPRHVTSLQSFAPHTNYGGRATEFPSQGWQLSLLSWCWSLSKQH